MNPNEFLLYRSGKYKNSNFYYKSNDSLQCRQNELFHGSDTFFSRFPSFAPLGFSTSRLQQLQVIDYFKHNGCVNTASWMKSWTNESYNSSILVTSGDDCIIKLWDTHVCENSTFTREKTKRSKLLMEIDTKHESNIFHCEISPWNRDEVVSCAGDGKLKLFNLQSRQVNTATNLYTSTNIMHTFIFDIASDNIIYTAEEDGFINQIDLRTKTVIKLLQRDLFIRSIAQHRNMCPSGYRLLFGGSGYNIEQLDRRYINSKQNLDIYSPGQYTQQMCSHRVAASHISFSKCGRKFLVNFQGDQIYSFSVNPTSPIKHFIGNSCHMIKPDVMYGGVVNEKTFLKTVSYFGPNDCYVVAGSDHGGLCIWKEKHDNNPHHPLMGSDELVAHYIADENQCNGVVPHPHLPILVSYGIDSNAKLWSYIPHSIKKDKDTSNIFDIFEKNKISEFVVKGTRDHLIGFRSLSYLISVYNMCKNQCLVLDNNESLEDIPIYPSNYILRKHFEFLNYPHLMYIVCSIFLHRPNEIKQIPPKVLDVLYSHDRHNELFRVVFPELPKQLPKEMPSLTHTINSSTSHRVMILYFYRVVLFINLIHVISRLKEEGCNAFTNQEYTKALSIYSISEQYLYCLQLIFMNEYVKVSYDTTNANTTNLLEMNSFLKYWDTHLLGLRYNFESNTSITCMKQLPSLYYNDLENMNQPITSIILVLEDIYKDISLVNITFDLLISQMQIIEIDAIQEFYEYYPAIISNLVITNMKLKRWDDALKYSMRLQEYYELNKRLIDNKLYYRRGLIYMNMNDIDNAISSLQKGIALLDTIKDTKELASYQQLLRDYKQRKELHLQKEKRKYQKMFQ